MLFRICSLLFLLSFPLFLNAKVWTYQNPGQPVKKSPFYAVKVYQDEQEFDSFIYFSEATFKDSTRSSSWTTFSFSEKIKVEVEVFDEVINTCLIRPKSKKIPFKIEGNKISFELENPQKLALEINGNKKKPLFIFADEPEVFIPEKNAKGVWYFEPGVHEIGKVFVPDSVKQIYIAGGAYIRGAFINEHGASGFKLTGRGVIASDVFPKIYNNQRASNPDWRDRNPHNFHFKGDGKNVLVEGITFSDGPMYGLIVRQSYATVRNCKFFGWYYNTDGVSTGEHGLIEDCFFRCNDDAIKVYQNYLKVNNCIFWQNDNGAPFQISWNLRTDNHNFYVKNCDVIHCEHHQEANNRAVFNAIHGGEGNLSDYLFEDIRIEDDVFRLFKLTIRTSPSDGDPGYGSIAGITFKNIYLEGKCLMANEIWGHNENHKIKNVLFDNLKINGKHIQDADEGNFKINLNTTENISFQ